MIFIYCKLSCNQKWCLRKKQLNLIFSFHFPSPNFKDFKFPLSPTAPSRPHSACPFPERQMKFLIGQTEFPAQWRQNEYEGTRKSQKGLNYVEKKIPDFICRVCLRMPSLFFLILLYPLQLLCDFSSLREEEGSTGIWPLYVGKRQECKMILCLTWLDRLTNFSKRISLE